MARFRMSRKWIVVGCVLLGAVVVVGSAVGAAATNKVALRQGAQLIACGDGLAPPVEFFNKKHQAVGFELDIAKAIAAKSGDTIRFHQIQFAGLIPALLAKQCDLISAGMFVKPERTEVINFAIYSINGQLIMVRKGNPGKVTGMNKSLAGKKIGMVSGYATVPVIQEFCKSVKPSCSVVQFGTSTDINQALKASKVDAIFDAATSVGYIAKLAPKEFQVVKTRLLQPAKVGYGFRKDDSRVAHFRRSIKAMYADGSMCKILARWGQAPVALPPHRC